MPDTELAAAIERLIDAHTLQPILQIIVDVCHAKADHLRGAWQDDTSALEWERIARLIARAAVAALGF